MTVFKKALDLLTDLFVTRAIVRSRRGLGFLRKSCLFSRGSYLYGLCPRSPPCVVDLRRGGEKFPTSFCITERLVDLSSHPQAQKEHGEFAGHGDDSPFLSGFAAPLRQFETPTFEVRVCPAGAQHILGALDEQMPEKLIAGFRDVELRLQGPGLILARTKTKIGAYGPGPGETTGIFYGEHEGQRR